MKQLSEKELDDILNSATGNSQKKQLSEKELDELLGSGDEDSVSIGDISFKAKRDPYADLDFTLGQPAADILEVVGKVLDYPAAPVRSAVGAAMDQPPGTTPLDYIRNVGEAAVETLAQGPSLAPSFEELALKAGVPEDIAPYVGFVGDVASGGIGGVGANLALKGGQKVASGLMKGLSKVVDTDDALLRALGLTSKQKKLLLSDRAAADKLSEAVEYGKQEIVTANPFKANTKKYLKNVQDKAEKVGDEIGKIYPEAEKQFEKFSLNPKNADKVQEVLFDGFNFQKTPERLFKMINNEIDSPRLRERVKEIIFDEISPLFQEFQGSNPGVNKLRRLKSDWQKEISWGKDIPREKDIAYNMLQREANRAIMAELGHLDKIMTGSNASKLSKLNKEYGKLMELELGLRTKAASEVGQPHAVIDLIDKTLKGQKMSSFLAKLPEGMKATGAPGLWKKTGIGQIVPGGIRALPEPKLEGFNVSETIEILPEEAASFEKEIQSSQLTTSEKARHLNLLRKHKRVVIGP
jgi:hypothetical protein